MQAVASVGGVYEQDDDAVSEYRNKGLQGVISF